MGTTTKTLYETDYLEWSTQTAELLRQRRFDEIDMDHLVEEIESLGRAERSAVRSQLRRMLTHLIKQRIQPERSGTSWRASIASARQEILDDLETSPSLRRYLKTILDKLYLDAFELAILETGREGTPAELGLPDHCPWSLAGLLEKEPKLDLP
jgi:hypothetical protein